MTPLAILLTILLTLGALMAVVGVILGLAAMNSAEYIDDGDEWL